MTQSFGFVSNNPLMKNITDYLVDEGSYEEDILLGNSICISFKPLLEHTFRAWSWFLASQLT